MALDAYIRAVGTFVSRYRIDSLELYMYTHMLFANVLYRRVPRLCGLLLNPSLQHRIGGLEICN